MLAARVLVGLFEFMALEFEGFSGSWPRRLTYFDPDFLGLLPRWACGKWLSIQCACPECVWVGGWVEKAAQENVSLEKTFHRFGSLDRDSQRAVLRCLVLFGCSTRG